MGLDQDVKTKLLGPISRAEVVGSDGGVDFSVRMNSDEREFAGERERERTRGRERMSNKVSFLKLKQWIGKKPTRFALHSCSRDC